MSHRETCVLLKVLAGLQNRLSDQIQEMQREIADLRRALVLARGREIVSLSRLHWQVSAAPLPPPSAAATLPQAAAKQTSLATTQQLRAQLSLLTAEVVICQSGCLSQDAYWRVREYCRRNGKRCLFVAADEVESTFSLGETSPIT